MVFTKRLRMGIRLGIIKCSIRIWKSPRVKVSGRYPMDEGHIVVDLITQITVADITHCPTRTSRNQTGIIPEKLDDLQIALKAALGAAFSDSSKISCQEWQQFHDEVSKGARQKPR